ncbi:hypothetical protein H920_00612 [Fukomys damarensis]|uniref:Meiotic recombination protein REC114 n=1 Tax=Fukomys damarensis TaxID=885580 RepID=A0A091E3R8_FUKDA|nr:hypothetical protein H920_00612 [Fukomys damarensis]
MLQRRRLLPFISMKRRFKEGVTTLTRCQELVGQFGKSQQAEREGGQIWQKRERELRASEFQEVTPFSGLCNAMAVSCSRKSESCLGLALNLGQRPPLRGSTPNYRSYYDAIDGKLIWFECGLLEAWFPSVVVVFDSNEESGYLVLTIVISGHFFISQGQTLLNKSRMFRIQFGGESKEQALEHCCSCVQSLARYTTVEVPDSVTQPSPGLLRAGDHQGRDCVKSIPPLQPGPYQDLEQGKHVAAGIDAPEGKTSVAQLAQSVLASKELPLAYQQSAWSVEELGPFLRLCLMDQNFPAFVEKVENELKKLTGMRN